MAAPTSVEDYLAALPDGPRAALEKLRKAIKTAAPEAIETISYQMPAFRMHGQGLVSYAVFKRHRSLFAGRAVIEALGHELEPYLSGKSTFFLGRGLGALMGFADPPWVIIYPSLGLAAAVALPARDRMVLAARLVGVLALSMVPALIHDGGVFVRFVVHTTTRTAHGRRAGRTTEGSWFRWRSPAYRLGSLCRLHSGG
jgi:uncharacterized protein YdhG (YjbR/CyaY superfamily)